MNDRLLHPEINFNHILPLQIRFSDFDTFGHVNNNSYMAFFDLGKMEYMGSMIDRNFNAADVSAVIASINVDFLAPAVMGEQLDVRTAVTHLGERSFTLYQRVVGSATGSVKAQATTVIVGFDIATQTSAPLRPLLADALSRDLKK